MLEYDINCLLEFAQVMAKPWEMLMPHTCSTESLFLNVGFPYLFNCTDGTAYC